MREEMHGGFVSVHGELAEVRGDLSSFERQVTHILAGFAISPARGGRDGRGGGRSLPGSSASPQPWMSQPSVARAASITASANDGCAWMMRATSG
jgi:hypothetical protein